MNFAVFLMMRLGDRDHEITGIPIAGDDDIVPGEAFMEVISINGPAPSSLLLGKRE